MGRRMSHHSNTTSVSLQLRLPDGYCCYWAGETGQPQSLSAPLLSIPHSERKNS